MNPINYLYFTLMSVIIQFCLMDFTTNKIKTSNISMDTNGIVAKKSVNEIFKKINQTPHALYYRNDILGLNKHTNKVFYDNYNSTLTTESNTMATPLSTSFELLYDENVTILDTDFTTESFFTSTEFDNNTEITFSNKVTTEKPEKKAKTRGVNKCYCNLLYQICDINCCCDDDCTANEIKLFKNFNEDICTEIYFPSYTQYTCDNQKSSNAFANLFCFAKINLPEKKTIYLTQVDVSVTSNKFKWHKNDILEVTNTKYNHSNLVWRLNNGSFDTIDIPIPVLNNYCSGKTPIKFLRNEDIKCHVKLSDIHMFQVINILHGSSAVTLSNFDSNTILNCSSLQCTKWTIVVCNDNNCDIYNKSHHDPFCSDGYCSNVAHQIEYSFYCNDSGLINAIINLTVQKVSLMTQYVTQNIRVRFYMTNDTRNRIQLSGNPGYLYSLPIIVSFASSNHTSIFYNTSVENHDKYLLVPFNRNGECIMNNITHNKVLFGQNKRSKCKLTLSPSRSVNGTDSCLSIQMEIVKFFKLNKDIFISPYGNPQYAASDNEWILLPKFENNVFGEYQANVSKLKCYGIPTIFSFVFIYADVSNNQIAKNKVTGINVRISSRNLTINIGESISTVVSIDVNFIEAKIPLDQVYAGAPHLNINLPANFFLPFY